MPKTLTIPGEPLPGDVVYCLYRSQANGGGSNTAELSGFTQVSVTGAVERIWYLWYKRLTEENINDPIVLSDNFGSIRRVAGLFVVRNVNLTTAVSYAKHGETSPNGLQTPSVSGVTTPVMELVLFTNENNDRTPVIPVADPEGLTRLAVGAGYNGDDGNPVGENPGTPTTIYMAYKMHHQSGQTITVPNYTNVYTAEPGRSATIVLIAGR